MKSQTPEENQGRRPAMQAKEQIPVSTLVASQKAKVGDTNIHGSEGEDPHKISPTGEAGLAVILGQVVAYFSGRADVDDMDVLSFSLHHLFCRVDYLYRNALPELLHSPISTTNELSPKDNLLQRQFLWSKLRAIQHTINRMEPLSNLLNDATKCILDALDMMSGNITSAENTISLLQTAGEDEWNWLQALSQEHWNQALRALTESLSYWQQSYSRLARLTNYFAGVVPTTSLLIQLDEVFNAVLASSNAIFGDILPGFQAISSGDDVAVATLLFDLMQQADQLLAQFDLALEPLHTLIEHFALISNR